MADLLPPLVASLLLNAAQFKAGLAEAGAAAKAETTAMGTAFNGMAAVGKVAFLGVAAGAAVVGVAAVKMAGDFESATNRLVTSAGEQRDNIDKVRAGLLDMAGQVGSSAMDLTAAYYQASSAGFTFAHGGLDVVRAAAEGAKAENADLAKVTDAVTSAMVDYHEPASAAAMVTTKIVAAVGQGKTTFEGLTGSLHSVLPVASAAHISLSDILGDVASMTVHGMSADQVTQNLAHTIEHLQKTTAPQNKELALLGINAQNLSSDLGSKGLSGTLMEIDTAIRDRMGPDGKIILSMQQVLHGLPPEVQALGTAVINGTSSVGELTKATKGLSVEQAGQVRQFESLMTSTHGLGANQKSGAQIAQSYAAALAAATGDATTLQVALMLTGDNASYTTGAIKAVRDATTEAGNHVAGWASIQGTFNQKLDRLREGLVATLIVLGTALIPIVSRAIDVMTGLADWLGKNHDVLIPLAAAIGGPLLVAIGAYTVSMASAAIATIAATWPLLAIIGAVALLSAGVAVLVTHWNQVSSAVPPLKALSDAWKALTADLRGGADPFTAVEDGLTALGVKSTTAMAMGADLRTAWQAVRPVFTTVGNVVKSLGNDIRAGVEPWTMLENALQAAGVSGTRAGEIGATLRSVWQGVQGALGAAGHMIGGILGPALAQIGHDAGPLFKQLGATVQSLLPILAVLGAIVGAVLAIAVGVLVGALKGLFQALAVALPGAIHIVFTAIQLVMGIIKLLADIVVGVVKIIGDILRGDWAGAWNDAKSLVMNVLGDIAGIIGNLFDLIGTIVHTSVMTTVAFISGFVTGIADWFMWLFHQLVGGSIVPDMINGIGQWFEQLPGKVLGVLRGLVTDVATEASKIGNAIYNGIVDALSGLAGALLSSVKGAINAIPGGAAAAHTLGILGYAEGGLVPGPVGAPRLAVVHGGELVVPADIVRGAGAGVSGGGQPAAPQQQTINVYASTSADPHQIGREVAWVLKTA